MNLDPEEGIALFTDGSCSVKDKSGGWGWVALDAFEGIHSGSGWHHGTTISQMELEAPSRGLFALAESLGPCDVLVYSDSQYVVMGMNDKTRARRANKGWWKCLENAVALHNVVEFHHVKGHSDHLYNEMADDLAGTARRDGLRECVPKKTPKDETIALEATEMNDTIRTDS